MALTQKQIRQIIREEIMLFEATRLASDSVDDQIDSIIIGYEEQSKTVVESRRRRRLAEAPENADEKEEKPAESETSVDSSERTVEDPAEPNKPKIDIDKFTTHIARFVQNSSNLLDIKTVIIERSKKFLLETYKDESLNMKFEELLKMEHDIYPSGEKKDEPVAPAAVGAGPGGA